MFTAARVAEKAEPVATRLATFNTFWLGTPERKRARRDADDEAALVRLLQRLDADALVLQEVVNLPYLEGLLARVRPGYRLRDGAGNWLTTGRMRRRISRLQKIVLAYDEATLELREVPRPLERVWPGPREPIVARFRARAGGLDLTLVGVHLKSGGLRLPPDSRPVRVRMAECQVLADWLAPEAPDAARAPQDQAVVVLGDFNASREHPSLAPLARLTTPAAGFTFQAPRLEPDVPGEAWSSFGERSVIDLALTSRAATARVTGPPTILAFDLDPEFDRPPGPAAADLEHFLRRATDLWLQPDDHFPASLLPNLYRLSDHRPLVLELRGSPGVASPSN
jgi:endonuclease/exonuclease/phosphatase family metal-dependent hydrolase